VVILIKIFGLSFKDQGQGQGLFVWGFNSWPWNAIFHDRYL